MRAQLLSAAAFFPRRLVCEALVCAEMPVGDGSAHGVVFDTVKNVLFCTCPFLPKPCVHGQALAALVAREGLGDFERAEDLPEWATALLEGRPAHLRGTTPERREAARSLRRSGRLERAGEGFDTLETWLLDTLRSGVATAASEDPAFFKNIAARLADASLRGLSRTFRLLDTHSPDWAGRAAAALAEAALALRAFRQRDQLPEALLADLENFIGIAATKETALARGEALRDRWAVLGVAEDLVEWQLRSRRTWLRGAESRRFALLLEYAHGDGPFPPGFEPGTGLVGTLVFYPSALPLRALAPEGLTPAPPENPPEGHVSVEAMRQAYAEALGCQPWLGLYPVLLNGVIPCHWNGAFWLTDSAGHSLPLQNVEVGWPLVAFGEGRGVTVFGEWDGAALRVLSGWGEGRYISFSVKAL